MAKEESFLGLPGLVNPWTNGYKKNGTVSVARVAHTLVSDERPAQKALVELSLRTVYALTTAMLGVLIYELVYNANQQGNPFSFRVRAFWLFGFECDR